MIVVTELVLVCAGLVLAFPVLAIFLQALAALAPRSLSPIPQTQRPRVAVLVPAHNEERALAKALQSIGGQLTHGDRLVVIADNCSDNTAGLARQLGAEVTERSNPAKRGKGYALDHGLDFLEQSGPPGIVIFVDADCQLNAGCIDRLARASFHAGRPVQGAYLMNAPSAVQKTASIVSFAWKVKDFVRPLGWHRLGLPCQLAGSGMAFPWNVIRSANLASGDLAEDLKLGLDLALAGVFPLFRPDAVVASDVAVEGKPSASQRARWEHGTMDLLLRYLPRLLARFCRAPTLSLLAVALDLSVPPLALLALALSTELALSLALLLVSGAGDPALLSIALCSAFLAAIIMAWWGHGRDIIPLRWLIFAPAYAIRKIPMYGRFFRNRQRVWVVGERR